MEHTEILLGKKHGTEYWAMTSRVEAAKTIVMKRRGCRDFEDSDAEEASRKLQIPLSLILRRMEAIKIEH